jgi:hypothetical protein
VVGLLQRSEGTVDTYVSGTLPERLYKRAQLQIDDDDDNTDGCYRLTAQDAPITVSEMETILAVEEDARARSRVATSRAIESREQGTLGIASLF